MQRSLAFQSYPFYQGDDPALPVCQLPTILQTDIMYAPQTMLEL